MYIYPDNLKSKAVMWMWELKDLVIVAISAIVSVLALSKFGFMLPLAATAGYAFLTIRIDDISIMNFIQNAWQYFVGTQQTYEWGMRDE